MPHEPTLEELREKKKKNDAYITKISQRTHAVIAISFWRKTADVCCLKRRLILSNC